MNIIEPKLESSLDQLISNAQSEADELPKTQFKQFVNKANGISNHLIAKEKKQALARKKSKIAKKSRKKNRK